MRLSGIRLEAMHVKRPMVLERRNPQHVEQLYPVLPRLAGHRPDEHIGRTSEQRHSH